MAEKDENLMEKIISLSKRRGFVFPSSEIYGGLANAWDFGPYGVQLKKNIKDHWWKFFVESRDNMVGLDAAIIMNPKVWEASGHIENFTDPLVECKKCHHRFRADKIDSTQKCPDCGGEFTPPKDFNGLMKTYLGPVEDPSGEVFLRPETAQAMFVDFNLIQQTSRKKLPFGVGQIGKAFRNEITPGNFIFRTREFEQMEIEYFFDPKKTKWEEAFKTWKKNMQDWIEAVGIDMKKVHAIEMPDEGRAHYSKCTVDFEFEYPFKQEELFGLAYRGDYDLEQHEKASGQELRYIDPETNEKVRPHVIEPSLGVERAMLAILLSSYQEEEVKEPSQNPSDTVAGRGDTRVVLKLSKNLAPVKVAVFPLMKNKPELVAKAKEVFDMLKTNWTCEFDDNGNVGKRYRRQDEIGTPYCVTIDFDTIKDDTVTIRDRDTMEQGRVKIEELKKYIEGGLNG